MQLCGFVWEELFAVHTQTEESIPPQAIMRGAFSYEEAGLLVYWGVLPVSEAVKVKRIWERYIVK